MKSKGKKGALVEAIALIAGAVVANKISNLNVSFIPDKVKPFVPVLAGFFLAKKGSSIMKAAGMGMIAGGGVGLVKQFVPQLGLGGDDMPLELNGPGNYALSGPNGDTSRGNYALSGFDANPQMFG